MYFSASHSLAFRDHFMATAHRPPSPSNLDDEPPPAYSITPNPLEGETTVEYGPHRPFQPAPARIQRVNAQIDDSGDIAYVAATGRNTDRPGLVPPPRHPSVAARNTPPLPPRAPATRQISEFASDFYAAGAGEPSGYSEAHSHSFAPPPGPPPDHPSPPTSRYAPPPGAPPESSSTAPQSPGVPDDGRPTRIPIPGHPLLNEGRILVYPVGFECGFCTPIISFSTIS
jgi:hypothetical protein